ncbi:Nucleotide-binding universal stress protein, UspA family [Roseivivax halotolerans]|jgi:nucleotide-binding universal stress UspA family protein|uniref:Nucleotide-binding universal stress protein, UspA family n=1 Tax=Roseivivax halotolerans TaxID=93684 RepID=A0A1I5XWK6_9RHOB|nr:universal stress protein [Roseivivax halotolerans]SFQ36328.1 Nucleotide-binding universal stress protein, UspA family [Roseivivax halotolerans]
MFKSILVPVAPDHPERLEEQLAIARALAGEDARIAVLSVVETVPLYVAAEVPTVVFERAEDETRAALEKALDGTGLALEVVHGHAPTVILDKMREMAADLVIIRSHKPGLSDWVMGSTAGRVVRHAPCSVHVIR